jgi:excisionase family DNA binding protein
MKKNLFLPDMLSVKDVQSYLNLSSTTVYRLFNSDDFPTITIGGIKRIKKEDFHAWLERQKD